MRLVLLLSAVSLGVGVASIACSSAAPPAAAADSDQTEGDPSASATTTTPTVAATATATADPTATATATTLPDGGIIVSPFPSATGTIPIGFPTTTVPSTMCAPTSIAEVEPNNDLATANIIPAISTTYCGHVEAGDVDSVTVIMPQQVFNFQFGFDLLDGPPNFQLFVGGVPVDISNGSIQLQPGQPYTFQISGRTAQPLNYRMFFSF